LLRIELDVPCPNVEMLGGRIAKDFCYFREWHAGLAQSIN
jgi:hypothetical protein